MGDTTQGMVPLYEGLEGGEVKTSVHEKLTTFLSLALSPSYPSSSTPSSSSILHFNPGISSLIISRSSTGSLNFDNCPRTEDLEYDESCYLDAFREHISTIGPLSIDCVSFGTHFCVFKCKGISSVFSCGLQSLYDCDECVHGPDRKKENWIQVISKSFDERVQKISIGEMHCLVLTENGNVYSVGRGTSGELGLGVLVAWQQELTQIKIDKKIIDISAGSHYSIFVSSDGLVYTCGSAAYCRLGISNKDENEENDDDGSVLSPKWVSILEGIHVTRCFAGTWHAMVVVDSTADVFVWGWNKFGQIGSISGENDIVPEPKRLTCFDFLVNAKDTKREDVDFTIHDIVLGSFCSLIVVVLSNGKSCVFVLGLDGNDRSMLKLPFDFDRKENENKDNSQYDFSDILYRAPFLQLPVYMKIVEPTSQIILMWEAPVHSAIGP